MGKIFFFSFCLVFCTLAADSYRTEGDFRILTTLRAELNQRDYNRCDILISDGVVTLQGTVRTETEAKRAEEAAERISGVVRVINCLTIGNFYSSEQNGQISSADSYMTGKDLEILVALKRRLVGYYNTQYDNISVSVSNGVVRLEGTVHSQQEAQNAVREAEGTPGVRSVINRIQVRP